MTALILHSVIAHGYEGTVNGEYLMEDGKRHGFCDVCAFRGAKGAAVKSNQSYVIELS